jgi:hypothetical protein
MIKMCEGCDNMAEWFVNGTFNKHYCTTCVVDKVREYTDDEPIQLFPLEVNELVSKFLGTEGQ